MEKIPLHRPFIDEDEINQVKQVLKSGWLTKGPKAEELENECLEYLSVKYAVAVTSCTAALHLALLGLDVGQGDEVLVADYTFPATGHTVLYCGAIPKFIDINPKTYNIDPYLIEKNITERTKAIIPVHTFGQPADMDSIMNIARKYDIKVIEDAACAFGSEYKGRKAGSLADIGCFSFHATKGITTGGEGGLITTNDKEIADRVRMLSVFGKESSWELENSDKFFIPEFSFLGFNYKMSDVSAAIGIAQFHKVEKIIKKKTMLANYWTNKLQDIELITSPYIRDDIRHNYQGYTTLIDKGVNRNLVIEKMKKLGIQLQIGTYCSFTQPIYSKYLNIDYECPVSLDIYNRSMRLPLYYNLREDQIDYIVPLLKIVLNESKY